MEFNHLNLLNSYTQPEFGSHETHLSIGHNIDEVFRSC